MSHPCSSADCPHESRGMVFDIQRFSLHDGPGIRTCVFLKGCPLRCSWCSNPESQSRQPELMWSRREQRTITVGECLSVADVMAVVLRDRKYYQRSGGGLTLTGGEFMLQPEFSEQLIRAAHDEGLTVVGETSGAVQPSTFTRLVDQLDLVMMDLKHHDPIRHVAATRAQLRLVLDNAAYLANSAVPHIFRIPVVPGVNDSPADADAFARLLGSYGIDTVELVAFHQLGKGKYADLDRAYRFADARSLTTADLDGFRARLAEHGVASTVEA